MKILNTPQTKELDNITCKELNIKSIDLIEKAATACVDWIVKKYTKGTHFTLFCGVGNNGADGLAIARLLLTKRYKIEAYHVKYSDKVSVDNLTNLNKLKEVHKVRTILNHHNIALFQENTVVIDAMLGSGLRPGLPEICIRVQNHINYFDNEVIAIDTPSGLAYENNIYDSNIVKANHTLTFEYPKMSFLLPTNHQYVGTCTVLSINLNPNFIDQQETSNYYTTQTTIQHILKPRKQFDHKGNFGHVELIGGSYGKIGAIQLATKACLHTGVGLLTTYAPTCANSILQTSIPEAMFTSNGSQDYLQGNYISTNKTVAIGPGLGTLPKTQHFLHLVIKATNTPMVLDADALNILSKNKEWLNEIPKNSILTPHPKEFERLVGEWNSENEKLEKLRIFSKTNHCFTVLKGAHTAICTPTETIYFNSTGNPGMATGGSGDVLTGILVSLLAQNHAPEQAAILGVYLHGLAGDISAKKHSEQATTATSIIENIGNAYLAIKM
ncbi:NAD(P)H-hydrate dehydratase [Flavobacteriaceae bacterium]|nr:NAD(P)H-hydrate dehydratase [Flavobacteriaceae bacterium]